MKNHSICSMSIDLDCAMRRINARVDPIAPSEVREPFFVISLSDVQAQNGYKYFIEHSVAAHLKRLMAIWEVRKTFHGTFENDWMVVELTLDAC